MDPSRLYFSAIPQTAESNLPHRLRVQFLAKDTAAGLQITRIAPDSPSAMTQGIPDFTPTATESIFFRIIGILILMLVLFSGSFRTDSLLKSIDPFFWPIARVFGALLRHLPRRNRHKILLVRPGGLGDLICLHLALLRVGIDPSKCQWLIEKRSEPWAKLHGLPYECYDSGLIKTLLKWAGRFEQVVDTEQRFGLSGVMALACAAPGAPTFGFRTNRASRLLSVSCDYDPYREHEIDSFERLMKMFLERLTPETRALIDTHLTHTPNMESKVGAKPVIGIAGLQVPSREFSLSQWAAWTRGWVRDRDFSIVAAPPDLEFAKSLAEAFPGQATVQCGNFEENCQTIASASEVFTVDGGMVHIASFYGIPTTAVFTSGRVEKWAPRAPNSQVIKRYDLSCQPCAIFGQVPKCPHGFACKDTSKMNG
jgi:ADP-heptose:LPS heptosyltransferase